MLASSAEDEFYIRLDMLHISLIYRIHSLGSNIEPCGIPHEIFRISELHFVYSMHIHTCQVMCNYFDNY